MGDAARQPWIDHAIWLASEREADRRHEWLDGQVYAMAGGTPLHNQLSAQVIMELGRLLGDRSCRVYTSDQRVRVLATGLSTYPDVAVACGDVQYDPDDSCAITNPRLLVEVLSDSTELYDRTGKFRHYKRIPSLRDYVLVSQHEARIEVYSRNDAGRWLHDEGVAGGTVVLTSLDAAFDVDRVYRNVVLDPSVALR